jgi:hypothetical protein
MVKEKCKQNFCEEIWRIACCGTEIMAVAVIEFELVSRHSPEGTEENSKTPVFGAYI